MTKIKASFRGKEFLMEDKPSGLTEEDMGVDESYKFLNEVDTINSFKHYAYLTNHMGEFMDLINNTYKDVLEVKIDKENNIIHISITEKEYLNIVKTQVKQYIYNMINQKRLGKLARKINRKKGQLR